LPPEAITAHSFRIATRLRSGRSGVRISAGASDLSIPRKRPDGLWSPLRLVFNGHWGFFSSVKRPGREADHSTHIVPRLRVSAAISSAPLYVLMACVWGLFYFMFHLAE
jgi:hypothetical protein